jgi:3-dehydroquinate synthase
MSTVRVNLSERSYEIEIGSESLAGLGRFVAERGKLAHAVVIADGNVAATHGQAADASLAAAGARVDCLSIPPGEESKSVAEAARLWHALLDLGADRKSIVVAVGGGVIGDLAGFVAATYGRGIPFVQVPTTLLAMVDSSVGGKVGVNLPGAKNIVGAFWQPRCVLIDTATLDTLPEREYRSGLAEVVKYGVILDAEFFAWLEENAAEIVSRDAAALAHLVTRCCELKAQVVASDEREETGQRAVLNYGHTFAHAIETVAGYGRFLHGEAVSLGMCRAARLAELLKRVDVAFVARQRALLVALGLPVDMPDLPAVELLSAMQRDKKTEQGKLRFVLPDRLGHVELVSGVNDDLARSALVQ